jgi:predicted  nucleic acid-binding Zn-ribbon protein
MGTRLNELERELSQARARIAELEKNLAGVHDAGLEKSPDANAETLRKWNAELDAAGGEGGS